MATPGTQPPADHLEKLSWYLSHTRHTVWDAFSDDQQQDMLNDDLFAGKSVATLLFSVITAGLVMSIVSVLVIWWLS